LLNLLTRQVELVTYALSQSSPMYAEGIREHTQITIILSERTDMAVVAQQAVLDDVAGSSNTGATVGFLAMIRNSACSGLVGTCSASMTSVGMSGRRMLQREHTRELQASGSTLNVTVSREYDFARSGNVSVPVADLVADGGILVSESQMAGLTAFTTVVTYNPERSNPEDSSPVAIALSADALRFAMAQQLPALQLDITSAIVTPPVMPPSPVPPVPMPLPDHREPSDLKSLAVASPELAIFLAVLMCIAVIFIGLVLMYRHFIRPTKRRGTSPNSSRSAFPDAFGSGKSGSCTSNVGDIAPARTGALKLSMPGLPSLEYRHAGKHTRTSSPAALRPELSVPGKVLLNKEPDEKVEHGKMAQQTTSQVDELDLDETIQGTTPLANAKQEVTSSQKSKEVGAVVVEDFHPAAAAPEDDDDDDEYEYDDEGLSELWDVDGAAAAQLFGMAGVNRRVKGFAGKLAKMGNPAKAIKATNAAAAQQQFAHTATLENTEVLSETLPGCIQSVLEATISHGGEPDDDGQDAVHHPGTASDVTSGSSAADDLKAAADKRWADFQEKQHATKKLKRAAKVARMTLAVSMQPTPVQVLPNCPPALPATDSEERSRNEICE